MQRVVRPAAAVLARGWIRLPKLDWAVNGRAYATTATGYARNSGSTAAASGMVKVPKAAEVDQSPSAGGVEATANVVFWMRHPKTGCWVPEDRFEEVDAAELRKALLYKK